MNKMKLLREKSGRKDRSATKERDVLGSEEKTGFGKNETPVKMEKEEHLEKQPSHDSNSVGINFEGNLKDTQELSRKTTNTISPVLAAEESIITSN